uniref:Uncharacterized protein n=1 Tax=Manihot esculenta TaxID=3983 RepID=A0A2C9VJ87_MANES
MTSFSNSVGIPTPLAEGYSITRPPIFNSINYSFWKEELEKKTKEEYTYANWKKKFSPNAKTLYILHCALNVTKYNRVSSCESTKEVWNKFEVTCKGTNEVKELKEKFLVCDFELFEMKLSKAIAEMSTRFTNLDNLLKALRNFFEKVELVKKNLRSLPKSWEVKIVAIFDTKNFRKNNYNELIG